jgi:hypothetical protein
MYVYVCMYTQGIELMEFILFSAAVCMYLWGTELVKMHTILRACVYCAACIGAWVYVSGLIRPCIFECMAIIICICI